MYTISFLFEPLAEPINGRYIHAKGLHGFLFNVTGQADREDSDWLHKHPPPRPFAMVPLYTDGGHLVGIRLSAFTDRVASLFRRTGEWFCREKRPCHLGGQEFYIDECRVTPTLSWQQLSLTEPSDQVRLRFISPTAFKQGHGHLRFPLPANVFRSPAKMWEAFAPPMMLLAPDWLLWCRKNVFVTKHRLETIEVPISQTVRFTGFVGEAWFEATRASDLQLRTWQALADLALFCGVGHKTTMGLGAVERF